VADWPQPRRSFAVHANAASEWHKWKDHFELYLKASEKTSKNGPTKVAILLTAMSPDAIDIYKTVDWGSDQSKHDLDTVLQKFTGYFIPQRNETYERFSFHQRQQKEAEPFETFYTDLLRRIESCKYNADERLNFCATMSL